ncbi:MULTISPECIES: GNAT family N-acetyltransferase [unclassified Corallococcus]|uniref:GNAT family N-acetyltransferase n=1 Tax=unclassified Corallococcus TaxID=2685029 RepID=UPI001A8C238B|nr:MULTISPECIES: GNAT family N-acetyltransferase [unclassified Corallococcus]MBN9684942.1 GNAT family N-acetyltransferase [Corallococcus sp. NCSPR001]WAS83598.1 GNAT family N-acetyltransferase [Corallococcus sp. NCRR]
MSLSYATLPLPVVPAPFRVRVFTPEDMDGVIALYSHPEVARSLNFTVPVLRETLHQKLTGDLEAMRQGKGIRWVLSKDEDPTPLGYLTLFNWSPKDRRAEVGYMVGHSLWGQGVMTGILPALIRFGFEQLNLHRIEGLVNVRNSASAKALTRVGFQQEGVMRGYQADGNGGGFNDILLFALLEDAWRASVAT